MRTLLIFWVCLLCAGQSPAHAIPASTSMVHFSTQTKHHSKPENPKQENREEGDELADEDEDFPNESLISWAYTLIPIWVDDRLSDKFYIVGESVGHVNPIVPPPDWRN